MSEYSEAQEALKSLVNNIYAAIDTKLFNANFDITKDAFITSVLTDGYYQVQMDGKIYKLKSTPKSRFSVGDQVTILIPENNYEKMRIHPKNEGGSETVDLSNITWADLE